MTAISGTNPMKSTRIQRDKKKTARNLLGAFVLLGLAYWFVANSDGHSRASAYMMAGLTGIPALILLYRAGTMASVGECPSCDMYLLGISGGSNEGLLCEYCSSYVEGKNGLLSVTPDDRVSSYHLYRSEIPDQVQWPEGCCVCREAVTRVLQAQITEKRDASMGKNLAAGVATLGTMKMTEATTTRLEVPHCSEHTDGAVLEVASDADMLNPAIAFRAHGYLKDFCELNQTRPRA